MMRELAELGMRMARSATIGAEARAQAGESTAADDAASALALQRAAKMVRLTVALDKRLRATTEPSVGADIALDSPQQQLAEDTAWVMQNLWKLVGKPLIRNTLELAIETESEGAERERLLADLHERLVDRENELIARGPGQYDGIITGILQELGLSGSRVRPAYAKASAGRPASAEVSTGRSTEALAKADGLRAANDPPDPARPGFRAHPPP